MKKILPVLLVIFLIYTGLIIFCPEITFIDIKLMKIFQDKISFLPMVITTLPDCILYVIMITLPLVLWSIFFIIKKKYFQCILFLAVPIVAFIFNRIVKYTVCRQRPPFELHIANIHPESYCFPSTHTFVTFCLWGMTVYYLSKYCHNKLLRNVLIIVSLIWIIFIGISRVRIGVHYPSDVIGAYLLGIIILTVFIHISQIFEEKNNK